MNFIKAIHRCNLRCVLRPRNRAIPVFRCHFLVDTSTAAVCTASLQFGFLTLLKVDGSFVKLPVLILLNLYWIFTGFAKPTVVLIHKTWPCVRLELNKKRLNSLLIRASCPRLPDINSVETWWTCPQKWSRKFLPVSTSRLQPPQGSVVALHHNKQFRIRSDGAAYVWFLFIFRNSERLSFQLCCHSAQSGLTVLSPELNSFQFLARVTKCN